VAPWSALWSRNTFAHALPVLAPLIGNPFVRGAVSGIGAITAIAGVMELAAAVAARRPRRPAPAGSSPLADPKHENP
jgi:hypothetical protein